MQLASDRARGYWPDILKSLNVPPEALSRRNGPCPFCGGKDRYRFVDKDEGKWVCSNCTEGRYESGMGFIQRLLGLHQFKDVAARVHAFFDGGSAPAPKWVKPRASGSAVTPEEVQREQAKILKVWNEAVPVSLNDPVGKYLAHRLSHLGPMRRVPPGLRYHSACEYWEPGANPQDRPVLVGRFPAMLALGEDHENRVVQIHKTYLTPDGHKASVERPKKVGRGVGASAFALRIMDVRGDTLGVCEGIETGIAAALREGVPVWPCYSANSLERFLLPQQLLGQVKRLIIFSDNDPKKLKREGKLISPGAYAAEVLAKSARAQGLRPVIMTTARVSSDFADPF
ncbi:toprim domain-containing protein [Acidovorax sp.]|uniref:DUF7146 domain-containing protein n=1 Tax=Acidovorax sp. TaxID=1872122 RepID=UPI0025B7FEE9|nr:toprim domain-containing protein [Acidovorax sp.]